MKYSKDLIIMIEKHSNSLEFIIKEYNLKEYRIDDIKDLEQFIQNLRPGKLSLFSLQSRKLKF